MTLPILYSEIAEPDLVYPEKLFEEEILRICNLILLENGSEFAIIPKFGLDALVIVQEGDKLVSRMLEFKSYKAQRSGGVGFGNSQGHGPQVELLIQSQEKLALTTRFIRWVLVDATKPVGSARYAFFDCLTAKKYAMGGEVRHGKQNNFKISGISNELMLWKDLLTNLRSFLLDR